MRTSSAVAVPVGSKAIRESDGLVRRLARQARLRYVSDSEPGIERRPRGTGFTYHHSGTGRRIADATLLARIAALVIPPAWRGVWICKLPNGHLQATGRDERHRKQYLYHPRWQAAVNEAKFRRMYSVGVALPLIRKHVERDIERGDLSREHVAAIIVRLLDLTAIRIGNAEYARDNNSYGLTTLENRHVRVHHDQIQLSFRGKSGKSHQLVVCSEMLAPLVERCRSTKGKYAFQYQTESGFRPITSADVNQYLSELTDGLLTAKDFRMWRASVETATYLAHAPAPPSAAAAKRTLNAAIRRVSSLLGNTVAVCRKYYIHSGLQTAYLDGSFAKLAANFTPRRRKRLQSGEQLLLHVLDRL